MKKLKDLPIKYDFVEVEKEKYQTWLEKEYFKAGDISKKPYTIVIPPPNITGQLHIGHVLDVSLQDIIIRRKRMMGFDTLFLPGMDHASIATQTKVEEMLRKDNISRYSLGREKFLNVCWEWKEKYCAIIRKQWAKIGLSVDYSRERFTLDEGLNEAVNTVFVKMYQDGLIYHGEKIINWDIKSKTALSNIEVEYKNIEGAFYHFLYPFVFEDGGMEIVTTRPETMFADQALMVHPNDKRYQKHIGKFVYIPGTLVQIPIIADEYVDMTFGTGIVKVTPAHDPNDFEVGIRHNLARPLCMEEDGTMNHLAGIYKGMDRYDCRKEVVKNLQEQGLCLKIEKMIHSVGHSERTGVIVEPRLSKQWFVKMEPLANEVIKLQASKDKIHFFPARFEKIFLRWMENIQDWCISRQLWWGHQIPAWFRKNEQGEDEIYVGTKAPTSAGWRRDEDVLDTWFSSALWPFSTLGWPNETFDLNHYFPGDTLVTGYDIIFFWVARMVFQAKYLTNQKPFQNVLIHGIIRDEQGRKISKSLGNGPDIFKILDKFGIDSVRYFLTTTGTPGQDIRYSEEKIAAAWNYINKIWNISRYIGLQFNHHDYQNQEINLQLLSIIDKWILNKLNQVIKIVDRHYEKFSFGEASKYIYNFIWNDFASWYLEMTKVDFSNSSKEHNINTCAVLNHLLQAILKLLHPIMPFFTEDIYQTFNEGSICLSEWPKVNKKYEFKNVKTIDVILDIITTIRNIRAQKNVPLSKKINLILQFTDKNVMGFVENNLHYLQKFVNYEQVLLTVEDYHNEKCLVNVLENVVVIVPIDNLVNSDEEKQKMELEKEKMLAEIARCESLLQNPNFIKKAPANKISEEENKLQRYKGRLVEIEKIIEEL